MSRHWSRVIVGIASGLALVAAGCGDDGPPTVLDDASWSAPREQLQDDYTLRPWSADAFAATDMAFLPDGRALLITKGGWGGPGIGEVVLLARDGTTVAPILQLPVCTDAERGLLGIAIDPHFQESRRFFVYRTRATADCAKYSTIDPGPGVERVENSLSSFVFDEAGVDPASEVVFLDHLHAGQSSHNAGGLSFMPDGTLVVGVGEASTATSRDLDLPYGKVLRLDVSKPGYGAADNPFFDPDDPTSIRSLVYASGLRNPFRVAADPATGRVAVSDVGTNVYEEVNLVVAGADYGFPEVEGPASDNGSSEPALWYTHENGCNSIIGGTWLPAGWMGASSSSSFAFSDFGCGGVFVADFVGDQVARVYEIAPRIEYSLARVLLGPDDALYLVGVGPGNFQVQRLARDPLAR
jgi:glucose/arabinose dehydrogenase